MGNNVVGEANDVTGFYRNVLSLVWVCEQYHLYFLVVYKHNRGMVC